MKDFQFYVEEGMENVPIESDGTVTLELPDGGWVKLQYYETDGTVSLRSSRAMTLSPKVANEVHIDIDNN